MRHKQDTIISCNDSVAEIIFKILSVSAQKTFSIAASEQGMIVILMRFYSALDKTHIKFVSPNKVELNPFFIRSPELLKEVNEFCKNTSNGSKCKDVWKIYDFIKQVAIGCHFAFFPIGQGFSTEDETTLQLRLYSLDTGVPFDEVVRAYHKRSDPLLGSYDVLAHYYAGEDNVHIGHTNVSERKCRLCGLSVPDVTFTKKAHAISELLGNKSIVICDECDACNSTKINKLENSLAAYFSALRPLLGVRGKTGVPSAKEEGVVRIDSSIPGEASVTIISREDSRFESLAEGGAETRFHMHTPALVTEDIYRILSKFAISVLPNECFQHAEFDRIRKWILGGDRKIDSLPLIALTVDGEADPKYPQITVYKRKNEAEKNIPLYLCDFFAVANRFLFELPLIEDSIVMKSEEDWKRLFNCIPVVSRSYDWSFEQFDCSEQTRIDQTIIFKVKSNSN